MDQKAKFGIGWLGLLGLLCLINIGVTLRLTVVESIKNWIKRRKWLKEFKEEQVRLFKEFKEKQRLATQARIEADAALLVADLEEIKEAEVKQRKAQSNEWAARAIQYDKEAAALNFE